MTVMFVMTKVSASVGYRSFHVEPVVWASVVRAETVERRSYSLEKPLLSDWETCTLVGGSNQMRLLVLITETMGAVYLKTGRMPELASSD